MIDILYPPNYQHILIYCFISFVISGILILINIVIEKYTDFFTNRPRAEKIYSWIATALIVITYLYFFSLPAYLGE
jgi:hypothetical protein